MTDRIRFYRVQDEYGEFPDFSAYPFELKVRTWPTTEHFFHGGY